VIGHAPEDVLDSTVCVNCPTRSWTVRKDTPASDPSNITTSRDSWSQNPKPYRMDSDGTSLRGRTVRLGERDITTAVDAHHAGEPRLGSHSIDRILQVVHAASLPGGSHAPADHERQPVRRGEGVGVTVGL
jgi:hypothetical protein